MKHIKTFEDLINTTEPKIFFKVTLPITKEELETIIWKLGEYPKTYEKFISSRINTKENYFYLSFNKTEPILFIKIGHMPGSDYGYNYYINNHWKYLGNMNATPEEIEEYQMIQNAKKYNL